MARRRGELSPSRRALALERLRAVPFAFSAPAARAAARPDESELTRARIALKAAAERSFLATSHTKFGKSALRLLGRLEAFDRAFGAKNRIRRKSSGCAPRRRRSKIAPLETEGESGTGGRAE